MVSPPSHWGERREREDGRREKGGRKGERGEEGHIAYRITATRPALSVLRKMTGIAGSSADRSHVSW